MALPLITMPGQRTDVRVGVDVTPDGQLLSVAEIQDALRQLRVAKLARTATVFDGRSGSLGPNGPSEVAAPCESDRHRDMRSAAAGTVGTDSADINGHCVAVFASHAGAGASSVALAIADAAGAAGRDTLLVETAYPVRSGLVAAAEAELGLDPTGAWRRGGRGRVTVVRRASSSAPDGWPELSCDDAALVVADLGLPTSQNVARLAAAGCRIVVVCRPSVPGVRAAERLLDSITPVAVAALGGARWPREVVASLGPRLRQLRADGSVVPVPVDHRLRRTGLTSAALPSSVARAGRALLERIDAARAGGGTEPPPTGVDSDAEGEGTDPCSRP